MTHTVSAVVVNWRQADLTSAAVTSLEAQEGLDAQGVELRIVIVDNASGDGSAALLRERHPEHLVVETAANGGFGAGANAGIRATDAEMHVLLNNDAVAEPGFVAALVAPLLSDARCGAATARILLAERYSRAASGSAPVDSLIDHAGAHWVRDAAGLDLVNSTGNEMTRSGNGRDRDWLAQAESLRRPAGEVFGFSGGAAALRASALERVGLFDESLFMYYEDTELSWRLRRGGFTIGYAPDAVVRHAHAASSGTGSALFRFHNERNRVLVSVKTAPLGVAATALARTAVATLRSSAAALRSGTPDARAVARGRRHSLAAALRSLPAALAERRRIDREATVPRSEVARLLVAE